MNITKTVVGVDTAKRVFQLHWVDMVTGEIVSKQIKRAGFLEHFANRAPCLIGWKRAAAHSTGPGGSLKWAIR